MRRVLRHLFTLSSAASPLLFVAVCVLWVRSYRIVDALDRYQGSPDGASHSVERHALFAYAGAIGYGYVRLVNQGPGQFDWPRNDTRWHWIHEPRQEGTPFPRKLDWLGFTTWEVSFPSGAGSAHGFQVPLWTFAMLFAAGSTPGLIRARRWRRARSRQRAGRCPSCGYDLRASPERCPECGTPAK